MAIVQLLTLLFLRLNLIPLFDSFRSFGYFQANSCVGRG